VAFHEWILLVSLFVQWERRLPPRSPLRWFVDSSVDFPKARWKTFFPLIEKRGPSPPSPPLSNFPLQEGASRPADVTPKRLIPAK